MSRELKKVSNSNFVNGKLLVGYTFCMRMRSVLQGGGVRYLLTDIS